MIVDFGIERLVLILREIVGRHVVAEHVFARRDRLLARQELDQRRLPRPVDADQRDAVAALDVERRAGEHVFLAVALRHVAELGHNPSAGLRLRETKMDGLFIRRNFDALDLLEFLDAALHLFGFGRLRAEAVDESFELLDAVALIGVSGFQLRPALGLLLFVFRIAAGIEVDALVPDLGDARDGHIEEKAVVRNQHEGVRISLEIGFQPVARFEIEVVRRLVEQQQIRLFEQQFGQRDPHLPAAGEFLHAALPVFAPEAKAGEDGAHARFDVVAVARREFGLHVVVAFGDLLVFRASRDRVPTCGARDPAVPLRARGFPRKPPGIRRRRCAR